MWNVKIFPLYVQMVLSLPFSLREVIKKIEEMLNLINYRKEKLINVELYLVDDSTQAQLNSKFLSCSGPTNIISFPAGNTGILSLSLDTFNRECRLYGQNHAEHLLRLLAHGLAHLAGYEHGSEMDCICDSCLELAMNNNGITKWNSSI